MSCRQGKKATPNYGSVPFQLDFDDVETGRDLGLIRPDLKFESEDPTSSTFGYLYDAQKNVGVDTCGTQQAIQARWKTFCHKRGFSLRVKFNSTGRNNTGNAKYVCKKVHGQEYFDKAADSRSIECPFFVNVYSADGNWKTTAVNLCHNHHKFVGSLSRPHPDSSIQAADVEYRNRSHSPAEMVSFVAREMLPQHQNSTSTIALNNVTSFLAGKGIQTNKSSASRVLGMIDHKLRGDMVENYQKLEAYFRIMAERNPGSNWRVEKTSENVFQRACFVTSVGLHIFKFAKRLIGFDGAHLKEDMNKRGVYLVATCKD